MGFQRLNYAIWANGDIVVAEYSEALRRLKRRKDFGTETCGVSGYGILARATAHEIAVEQNEVRCECVDLGDHLLQEPGLGVLLKMYVGDLNDPKADKCIGQIADGEGAADNLELMSAMGSRIQSANSSPWHMHAAVARKLRREIRSALSTLATKFRSQG